MRGKRCPHACAGVSPDEHLFAHFDDVYVVCPPERVSAIRSTTEKHMVLHERFLSVQDLQSVWLLLLFCANARDTHSLRGIPPSEVAGFAEVLDEVVWKCFMRLWKGLCKPSVPAPRGPVSQPIGRVGQSLRTIHCQHPALADMIVPNLSELTVFRHFDAAASCREELCIHGYGAPGWGLFSQLNPKH